MKKICPYCHAVYDAEHQKRKFCTRECTGHAQFERLGRGPTPRKLPDNSTLITLYDSGLTCPDIAKRYGADSSAVAKMLRSIGHPLRRQGTDRHKKPMPKGENHPLYRGKVCVQGRETMVYSTLYGRRVPEHRYVMSEHLGRMLLRTEHVHHINGNHRDNCLENLQLVSNSEHHRIHRWFVKWRESLSPEELLAVQRKAQAASIASRKRKKLEQLQMK